MFPGGVKDMTASALDQELPAAPMLWAKPRNSFETTAEDFILSNRQLHISTFMQGLCCMDGENSQKTWN